MMTRHAISSGLFEIFCFCFFKFHSNFGFSCRQLHYKQIQYMKHTDENSAIAARTMDNMVRLVTNFVKYG